MDTNPFGLPRTKIGLGGVRLIDMAGADAAVSYGGFTVANKDSAGGAEIRGTGDARFTIADAVVRVNEGAPPNLTLNAALSNVHLENNNKGTTLSASVASGSLNGIQAAGGAVNLEQSEPDQPLSLQSLVITDGGRVSVSGSPQPRLLKAAAALPAMEQESAEVVNVSDGTFDIEQLAAATALPMQAVLVADARNLPLLGAASPAGIFIEENGNAQFGSGAVLNAGLTLSPGAKLVFDDVLTMDGCLNLGTGMFLEGNLLSGIDAMEPGDSIVLIQGAGDGLRYMEDLNDNQANLYFSNIDAAFKIMANGSQFGLVMGMAAPAPEPTTGMLSLLGVAALAPRRPRQPVCGAGRAPHSIDILLYHGYGMRAFAFAVHRRLPMPPSALRACRAEKLAFFVCIGAAEVQQLARWAGETASLFCWFCIKTCNEDIKRNNCRCASACLLLAGLRHDGSKSGGGQGCRDSGR